MKKSKTIAFLLALFMLLPNFNGVVYAAETALPAEKAIEGEGVIKGDKKVFKIDPNTVEKAMKTESKSNRHATSLYRAPEEETNTEIRLTTHGLNGEPFDWSVFENNEFNVTFSYTDNNGQLQEITSQTIEERNGGSIECYVKWPLQGMKAAQIETDFDENYDVRADCEPSNGEGNAGKIIFYLDVYELPNTNLKVEYKEIYGRDLRDNLPSDSDEAPNFKLSLGEGVVIPLPKKGTEVNLRDFETVEEELGEDAADDLVDNMETSILNALETLPITIDDNAEGTYTFGTGDAAKLYKYQINQASKADPSVIRLTYTPDIAVPQKSDGQYPPVPDGYVRLTFDANGENGLQGTFSDGQSVKHMDVKSSLKYDDEELQKQIKNLRATATENGITYTQSEATPWEPEVPTEGNVTTGTYTAKYAKSDATVIPYEPTDPDKPTSPDDKNIPTQDKDGNTVDKTNYVQVAFKVSPEETGLLNLGNVKNQVISALVKKDTTWDDVTLPTTTGQNDYVFWHWDKAEGNVTEGQVRVAKFVKDGDDITGDDTKLPDGYFSVALEKGEGIRDNALFGKTYAVKSDSKLAEDKFPNLEAQDNFKEPAWNVKNPWDQIITDHTTFTASAVSSVFDKNNVTIIEVTTQPKISYTEGEQLDLTGLVATLTDKNGNKQEVTFEDLGDYGITA
ncbi:MAG: bacterial Ig-like domain-containing protein, partial [Peptoniphilus sp.]